jgi:hypothetical protein
MQWLHEARGKHHRSRPRTERHSRDHQSCYEGLIFDAGDLRCHLSRSRPRGKSTASVKLIPFLSDGTSGPAVDVRPLFEQFVLDTSESK